MENSLNPHSQKSNNSLYFNSKGPIVIPRQKLFLKDREINLSLLKQALSKSEEDTFVDPAFIDEVINRFCEIVGNEPNVLYLNDPIRILGDIHGQYMDLLKLLSLTPALEENPTEKLLFLGDYVDRGINGTEVLVLLFSLKIRFPNQVYLLRGNHQSRIMTQQLNFFQQFTSKYPQDLYFRIMDAFDTLPLAAVVNDKYFCVHGGLSPQNLKLASVKDLNKILRFEEIPFKGQMCDMIWADPVRAESGEVGKSNTLFVTNDSRGCSIYFGKDLAQKFLKAQKLQTVIRAHQIINSEGYMKHIWPGWNDNPTVITIFSAPNYCGTFQNKAVILSVKQGKLEIRQFNQQNPKIHLSPQHDAFSLSVPRLVTFLDKFTRNLVKAYSNKNFPQLKSLHEEKKIELFLKAKNPNFTIMDGKELEKEKSINEKDKEGQNKQGRGLVSDVFKRSKAYFEESEKLPRNKIFNSKSRLYEGEGSKEEPKEESKEGRHKSTGSELKYSKNSYI